MSDFNAFRSKRQCKVESEPNLYSVICRFLSTIFRLQSIVVDFSTEKQQVRKHSTPEYFSKKHT